MLTILQLEQTTGDSTSFVAQGISGAARGRPINPTTFKVPCDIAGPDESLMAAQSIAATINAEQYVARKSSSFAGLVEWC